MFKRTIGTVALLMLPFLAGAQTVNSDGVLGGYIGSIAEFINGYIIPLIMAAAVVVFIWGMFQYFVLGGAEEEKRSKGKQFMIWATVGFVLILSFQGIVVMLVNFFGLGSTPIPMPDANPFN